MAKRKPQPVAPDEVKSAAEVRKGNDQMSQQLRHLEEEREAMLQPFASELPAETELLMVETKWFLAQASIAFIEVGRRLIVLHERSEHGEWRKMLAELNIGKDTANRSMRVAHKFGNLKSMLHLDPSKLVALLDVPDSELKHIDKKGVLGMSVDAIDAMTVRQLRDKLREARAKTDKGADQLQRADELLREKDAQIKALKIGPKTDTEYMELCSELQTDAVIAVAQLRSLFLQAQTETQQRALIGTIIHVEKNAMLASFGIRAALDPTNADAPADHEAIEHMADGINWHEPSVVEFLKKASADNGEEKPSS